MKTLLRLDDAQWVWANGANAGNQPAGKAIFRKVFQIPADRAVKQATFLLTADDGFQLFINGHPAGQGSSWKTLVQRRRSLGGCSPAPTPSGSRSPTAATIPPRPG